MNFWEKLRLKVIAENWEDYADLKHTRIAKAKMASYHPFSVSSLATKNCNTPVQFKHSGNSGDIIYALPAIKGISGSRLSRIFLQLDQKACYSKKIEHPLGNVMLNQKVAEMLMPLLNAQAYISNSDVFTNQEIDVDLDKVRDAPIPFTRLCLPRWYFLAFGVSANLADPWLSATPDAHSAQSIVIARSNRYRGSGISYAFLKKYPDLQFVGTEDEYYEMKQTLPGLTYRPVKNFLEMASVISGCKLFIGNQSFPFALAEALKVNRLLEVSAICPDVPVLGNNGGEFYFQPHFVQSVAQFMLP